MNRLVPVALMAFIGSAFAQDRYSTNSSGDYAMDLGQIYGAIQSVKLMGEICNESFPNQEQVNSSAYAEWRAKYLPFIQEMELHFSKLAWKESGGDPRKHLTFLADTNKALDQYRVGMKEQMSADGPEPFEGQCSIYPVYLASERMNIEHYYGEQVSVVRKGPGKRP